MGRKTFDKASMEVRRM